MMHASHSADVAASSYSVQWQVSDDLAAAAPANRQAPSRVILVGDGQSPARYWVASNTSANVALTDSSASSGLPDAAVATTSNEPNASPTPGRDAAATARRVWMSRAAFSGGWLFLVLAIFCFTQHFVGRRVGVGVRNWRLAHAAA